MNHSPAAFSRRTLLHAGAAAALAGTSLVADETPAASADKKTFTEPAREVPIVDAADVVVCGAGPAGVAAAIAAARAGAKTRLLEANGCLGGVWTAGLLSWILDWKNKPGFTPRLMKRLGEVGRRQQYGTAWATASRR